MNLDNASTLALAASDTERRFMGAVYRWMTLGLLVTAGVAWLVAGSPAILELIFQNRAIFWRVMIAQFGLVLGLSASVGRLSGGVAGLLFLLYSALTGVTFSLVLLAYAGASVASAFVITAGTFAAMSVYGTVTRSDLRAWGTFLFMGLVGVVLASVVNLFTRSGLVEWVVSAASVVVFTGLTAYDTQKLRRMAAAGADVAALPVVGALSLYLDFINLFLAVLRIFGGRRR